MKLSKYIKDLRESHNLTQIEFAFFTGLTQTTISKIESGKRKAGIQVIKKLSAYSGKSVEELRSMR